MSKRVLTNTQRAESVKALLRAEKHYQKQGYDPVDAVQMIYERALSYYDKVFDEDEVGFRATLLRRREKSLKRAYAQRRKDSLL